MIWQRNKFTLAGNYEYKETDCKDSLQSSLNSSFVGNPELKTLEWWISGLRLNPLFS